MTTTISKKKKWWELPRWRRLAAYVCMGLFGIIAISIVGSKADAAHDDANKAVSAAAEAKQSAEDVKKLLEDFKAKVEAQDLAQCKNSNAGRQNIRQTFTDIINIATQLSPDNPGNPPPSPEEVQQREERLKEFLTQFQAVLEKRLPLQDCNKDSVVNADDGVQEEVPNA